MLSYLKIKNFALMEVLEVDFKEGLNVLTGETGAGKSILIKALALVQGERSSTDFIRDKEETAEVSATFSNISSKIDSILKSMEIPIEDGQVFIKRTISRKGNHKVLINGESVTLSQLKTVASELLEICGQHDNQKLVDKVFQLSVLDEYGLLNALVKDLSKIVYEINSIKKEKEKLKMDPSARIQRMDFIKFQIDEINKTWISADDEKKQEETLRKALGSKDLVDACNSVQSGLYGEDFSVISSLDKIRKQISHSAKHEPLFKEKISSFENIVSSLEEIGAFFNKYKKGIYTSEEKINAIIEKGEELKKLKRKYGGDLDFIQKKKDSLTEELLNLKDLEKVQLDLDKKIKILTEKANVLSLDIREKRKKVAKEISEKVTKQLRELNMASSVFDILFEEKTLSSDGIDNVSFKISPNKGESLKDLDKIASGGELSRVMLALTRVLTEKSGLALYVFDEVDAGIGGDTGKIVGQKMKQVSNNHQVICITHLPQVAVYGDSNFLIKKTETKDRTISQISLLNEDEKIKELSRMLGGGLALKQSLENAKAMIEEARRN